MVRWSSPIRDLSMMNPVTPRTMVQVVDGLAAALSAPCGVDAGVLRLRISQVIAVWSTERPPDSFAKTFAEFGRFIDLWNRIVRRANSPLSIDDIAATTVRLREDGAGHAMVLGYLSAVGPLLTRLGLMTSELRAGFVQMRRNHTARATRKRSRGNVPTLHTDVVRLLRGANPQLPRDVRNMVMVLILFEGMAQFSEILRHTKHAKSTDGLPLSNVTFDAAGTSVITLLSPRADTPCRSVRLSMGATAWLRHWIAMRGDEPGSLLSYGKADPRGPRVAARGDGMPLWSGPIEFRQLAFRHGTSSQGFSAESLRLGRAIGLLDAGWSISRVARFGGWLSEVSLLRQLQIGLTALPKERRKREPSKLRWPLPVPGDRDRQDPVQLELRPVDAA